MMKPGEFVAMCRKLKEMGATKVSCSADGAFEATFGAPPRAVPAVVAPATPEPARPQEREPLLTPADAPSGGDDREIWRTNIIKTVSS